MKERKNNNKQTKHQQQRVNDVCALCAVCLLGAREKVPTSIRTCRREVGSGMRNVEEGEEEEEHVGKMSMKHANHNNESNHRHRRVEMVLHMGVSSLSSTINWPTNCCLSERDGKRDRQREKMRVSSRKRQNCAYLLHC